MSRKHEWRQAEMFIDGPDKPLARCGLRLSKGASRILVVGSTTGHTVRNRHLTIKL